MTKESIIEKASNVLREKFNIPEEHINLYEEFLISSNNSFLFRDDISESIEDRAYKTYIAWFRHKKTDYDMDIRNVTTTEMKETIKRMYNTMGRNYLVERMKMIGRKEN